MTPTAPTGIGFSRTRAATTAIFHRPSRSDSSLNRTAQPVLAACLHLHLPQLPPPPPQCQSALAVRASVTSGVPPGQAVILLVATLKSTHFAWRRSPVKKLPMQPMQLQELKSVGRGWPIVSVSLTISEVCCLLSSRPNTSIILVIGIQVDQNASTSAMNLLQIMWDPFSTAPPYSVLVGIFLLLPLLPPALFPRRLPRRPCPP